MNDGHEVAILGGAVRSGRDRVDASLQELVFEVSSGALEAARTTREQIDSVVMAASDLIDGRGIASMASAGAAGAYLKHETRTTADGLYAVVLAALEILAGRCRTVLVVSWNKESEVDWPQASPTTLDPMVERPLGLDSEGVLGLAACSALISDADLRHVASAAWARSQRHAAHSPWALDRHGGPARSGSRWWPLDAGDMPAPVDGGVGLVLSADPGLVEPELPTIRGMAWGSQLGLTSRALADVSGVAGVAADAYREAGVDAMEDVDLIELVARSSFDEVRVLQGLLDPFGGDAIAAIVEGRTEAGGDLPVNLSGGTAGGLHRQAAGLVGLLAASEQLRGAAGGAQLDQARTAVVHSQSGPGGQSNCVVVVGAGA